MKNLKKVMALTIMIKGITTLYIALKNGNLEPVWMSKKKDGKVGLDVPSDSTYNVLGPTLYLTSAAFQTAIGYNWYKNLNK